MPGPCTIRIHPNRETIDQQLLAGTPYRTVGKQHSVGVSAVFRHRRDHLTRLMANAVETRGVRNLEYGGDLLGQLEFLNGKTLKILDEALAMGDRRGALAAIREARSTIELNAKLCGQIREQHLHLHGHQQLTPEAHEQFMDAIEVMRDYRERCLPPQGSIRDDVHLLSGEAALPRTIINVDATEAVPEISSDTDPSRDTIQSKEGRLWTYLSSQTSESSSAAQRCL